MEQSHATEWSPSDGDSGPGMQRGVSSVSDPRQPMVDVSTYAFYTVEGITVTAPPVGSLNPVTSA